MFEYFKACTDWFAPENDEVPNGASLAAQRTWRIMAYLNDVEDGGATKFERLKRPFRRVRGMVIAWKNV